ncbi:hypothetical protein IQ273_14610 [Nodosilinea sp. LEGE 07298]|uniref:hypothetical protein n=1 Tax=Nodosilinea sp. LEGE 07298 TaxID=2777970 RepID=UPI0018826827|nr:hypothetical protein [Nodosilinea sp. LEGE 07298]MBE9110650.1 hypothetical protein [Nodosilinea sp. LEGE 07298]
MLMRVRWRNLNQAVVQQLFWALCAGNSISIRREGLIEQYHLGKGKPFSRVYLTECE